MKHKIFSVMIRDKMYEVWSRPETHNLGKMNGCPDNWWIMYQDEWHPYIDKGFHRVCWGVNYRMNNYTKMKWDELDFRSSGCCEILCNGRIVYEFGARSYEYGLPKAAALITEMSEHPFCFSEPEREIGRKVWYHRQPAIIDELILDQGCIMLKKDGKDGFDLIDPWDDRDSFPISEYHGEERVKDDILSKNIWWFRK